jgi:hypothetical protein
VSCQEFQDGSTCRHLIRMSFLTDFTPATLRATLTAWLMSACDLTKPLRLNHALKRFDIAILRPAVGRLPPRASGGAGPVGPVGPLPAPTRESPASTTE